MTCTTNQYTSITGMSAPVHDANGNLTSQNGVTYTWDSENRLLSVTPTTPAVGEKSLAYIYDAQHRRTIQEWNGSTWGSIESTRFIYDGWNVIAEYALTSTTETLTRELAWGTDLSGTLQGAGGVGGLLMVEEITSTTTTAYHFQYDGNGNVTEITDHTGASAATYRYDAFGNALVATGSYAATNKYRFSTKPLDNEIANAPLYYYGYRYYDPVTGRWPSRDPITERGGINLYGFVRNNGVNKWDVLGLATILPFPKPPKPTPPGWNPEQNLPWSTVVAIWDTADGDVKEGEVEMTPKIALDIVKSLPPIQLPGGDDSLRDVIKAIEESLEKAAKDASATQLLCVGLVELYAEIEITGKSSIDQQIYERGRLKVNIQATITKDEVRYAGLKFLWEWD